MEFRFWPYDELCLDIDTLNKEMSFKLPWLSFSVNVHKEQIKEVENVKSKFLSDSVKADDLFLVSSFFNTFSNYPICYILPQEKNGSSPCLKMPLLPNFRLRNFIEEIIKSHTGRNQNNCNFVLVTKKEYLIRTDFSWDVDGALSFSEFNTGIHPESLFSVARRYCLIDCTNLDKLSKINLYLKKIVDDSKRKNAIAVLLKQIHYVLNNFYPSIQKSLDLTLGSDDATECLDRNTKNQETFSKNALLSMEVKLESIPISRISNCLVELLIYIANKNMLAFAISINNFEHASFLGLSSLVSLLQEEGFQKAAELINQNLDIKSNNEYGQVSYELLKKMGPCGREYCQEALRLAELFSIFISSIFIATLKDEIREK